MAQWPSGRCVSETQADVGDLLSTTSPILIFHQRLGGLSLGAEAARHCLLEPGWSVQLKGTAPAGIATKKGEGPRSGNRLFSCDGEDVGHKDCSVRTGSDAGIAFW